MAAGRVLRGFDSRQLSPIWWQSCALVAVVGEDERKKRMGGGWRGVQRSRQHGVMSGARQNPEKRQLKGHHQPTRGAQAGRSTTVRVVLLGRGGEM